MGVLPPTSSRIAPALWVVEQGDEDPGDVGAGHGARGGVSGEGDPPGGRVVGEPAGSQDRPVEVAAGQVVLGGLLGAQVRREHLVGAGGWFAFHSHRGQQQVAADVGALRGVGEQDGACPVDGVLAGGAAAGAGAGGEEDGVGALEVGGELVGADVFEVGHDGLGAGGTQGGGVVGVADQPDGGVAASGEFAVGQLGDLAVSSGDDDAHTANLAAVAPRRGRSAGPGSGAAVEITSRW